MECIHEESHRGHVSGKVVETFRRETFFFNSRYGVVQAWYSNMCHTVPKEEKEEGVYPIKKLNETSRSNCGENICFTVKRFWVQTSTQDLL